MGCVYESASTVYFNLRSIFLKKRHRNDVVRSPAYLDLWITCLKKDHLSKYYSVLLDMRLENSSFVAIWLVLKGLDALENRHRNDLCRYAEHRPKSRGVTCGPSLIR